jgi:thioredoxin 1
MIRVFLSKPGQIWPVVLALLISLVWLSGQALAAPDSASKAIRFTADLKDGTKVSGELADLDALPLTADFGDVNVPLQLIHTVQVGHGDSPTKIRFHNGDLLSGQLRIETLVLATKYGRLSIAVEQIVRISATQTKSTPIQQAAAKAGIARYDDETWNDKATRSSTVTVVTAWAPWCAVCGRVMPLLTTTAGKYQGRVQFATLDVDRSRKTMKKLGIKSIPTMLVYRSGKLLETRVGGFTEEAKLRAWLDGLTKKYGKRKRSDDPFGAADPFG